MKRLSLMVACALFVAAAVASRRLGDPDLGWHLATGRSLLAHGLSKVDDLAFGHAPVRFITVFTDVLFYGFARAFGTLGLQILGGVLAALTGLVVFVHGNRTPLSAIVAAATVAALEAWVSLNAAELSLVALPLTIHLLETKRHRLLAPLFFAWANAHGFVAIGAAMAVGWVVLRRDKKAIAPVALAMAAACINMSGPRVFLGTARFGEQLGGITEWLPTTWHLLIHHEPLAIVFGVLGILAIVLGRPRPPPLFDCFAVAGALVVMFHTTRMIPVAVVVIAPIAARRFQALVPETFLTRIASVLAPVAAAAFAIVAPSTSLGVGFEPRVLPVAATGFVERAQPSGRMWNFWPFGGYLEWTLGPEREAFVDGRNTLAHDPETLRRAHASITDNAAFESLVDDLHLEWAIANAGNPGGVAQSRRFTAVYFDDTAEIYVKTDGANAALAKEGYRFVRPGEDDSNLIVVALKGGPNAEALAHDGELAAAQAPDSVRNRYIAACGALAAHDDARFEDHLAALIGLGAEPMVITALRRASLRR